MTRRTAGEYGNTPLSIVKFNNTARANHAAIVRCLEVSTAKYPPALLNQLTVKL